MFENYETMSADEKAAVKAIHKAFRAELKKPYGPSRCLNLAWGFVRGFQYRRIERKTRTQALNDGTIFHHNRPSAFRLTREIAKFIPSFGAGYLDGASSWKDKANPLIEAWLASEEGAIPAPPPREKKPYVPADKVA